MPIGFTTAGAVGGARSLARRAGVDPSVRGARRAIRGFTGRANLFGPETVRGWPKGVPDAMGGDPSLGTAGHAYQHSGFSGRSIALHPGKYTSGELGDLHDEITTASIRDGYRVIFYSGVENDQPAGEKVDVTGPTRVNFVERGLNDTVSAIAVFPRERSFSLGGIGGGSGENGAGDPGPGDTEPTFPRPRRAGFPMQGALLLGIFAGIILWIANQ